MSYIEIIILALAVSMDAFAVAICIGLGMNKVTLKKALIVGLYFGLFQAAMPVIGYFLASTVAGSIKASAHWIAFAMLLFLGIKMIWGAFKKEKTEVKEISLGPRKMLPYAIATSIDALAVGVTFAFLDVSIAPAVSIIGAFTLVLSMIGVKLGNLFGTKFKSKAEFAGGVVLILIGIKIVLSGYGVLPF